MKATTGVWLSITAMVVVVLAIFGGMYFFSTADNGTPLIKGDNDAGVKTCNGVSSVTYTLKPYNAYKTGTSLTGIYQYIYDPMLGNVTLSQTLPPLKTYKSLVGYGSGTYYAKEVTFETSCVDDNKVVYLAEAGAPTVSIVNDNGITQNTDSTPQSLDADDKREVTLKLKEPVNKQWGADDCNVIVFNYDKSDLDSIKIDNAESVGVPASFSSDNSSLYDGSVAYEVNSISDGETLDLNVIVESGSSNPSSGNFKIYLYDCQGTINDDGEPMFSVEDDDNNLISLASTSTTFYYN